MLERLRSRWVLLMFFGALSIHVQESLYRICYFDTFFSLRTQAFLQPIYFVAGWSLFWGFRKAKTFLSGWAVFIFFIVVSRTIINFYVKEPWNWLVVWGLVLMVYGLTLTMQEKNKEPLIRVGTILLFTGSAYIYFIWPKTELNEFKPAPWMFYIFIGAVGIAAFENMSRRGMFSEYFSIKTQKIIFPLNFVLDGALFYGYRLAKPSFIFAWAVYTIYDCVLRVANNKLLKEPFLLTHALGMLLVVAGTALAYLGGLH